MNSESSKIMFTSVPEYENIKLSILFKKLIS